MEQLEQPRSWPPTDIQFRNIACSALNKSKNEHIKVLVYWDNPTLMIYEPCHFAQTDYVRKKFETKTGTVEVTIGRED